MVNIIVAFPKMENGKSIKNILVKHGFYVGAVCTAGAQALRHADLLGDGILVCSERLTDMMCSQLREELSRQFEMLVLAAPGFLEEDMEHVMYLSMPLKVHQLISTLEMMVYSIEQRKKKKRFRPQKRSEEERQIIQKAKEILMTRNHMTEEEAHRYIQRTSMDSGTGLIETAQMILSMMQE
ncbi:MAG: ANTAR domain-containing protein [Lachnospiraceae bacterium]|nr:ANTAR domain-containing protein [Lachnospiraceae bacterium]